MSQRPIVIALLFVVTACGPAARERGDDDSSCTPGSVGDCYDGVGGTEGVGPCHGGQHMCGPDGTWGQCVGEVVPQPEDCTDGIDNNCNGMTDEDIDQDGDGFTTCSGHDCCDSTECTDPALVNPGAFDAPGNGVDDDCDGLVDNTPALCDSGLASNSATPMDYAKAMDLCQTTTTSDVKWGVIDAKLTLADGSGSPTTISHSIRPRFGSNVTPMIGGSFVELSTGAAAGKGDTNPDYQDFQGGSGEGKNSGFPADFLAANQGKLPNAPKCPAPDIAGGANDPVMLTLTIRVPTNAKSFTLSTDFFSSEFPEYTCSAYNDFFVVLLDSKYAGMNPNPTDKNLAFYTPPNSTDKFPVGVNLATGNTGLFTQCVNGDTGCAPFSTHGNIATCTSQSQLAGTGMDTPAGGQCNANSVEGGGTGWLVTAGNVVGGEIITLRIAIWDTSDGNLDSLAIVDGFTWSVDEASPGTVIF
jgi:hypothetical protein